MAEIPYVTDKQIIDETHELMEQEIKWVMEKFPNLPPEQMQHIAVTNFLYIKDKIFNHSPKFYREKELKGKK